MRQPLWLTLKSQEMEVGESFRLRWVAAMALLCGRPQVGAECNRFDVGSDILQLTAFTALKPLDHCTSTFLPFPALLR